jgi:polygalacturonase
MMRFATSLAAVFFSLALPANARQPLFDKVLSGVGMQPRVMACSYPELALRLPYTAGVLKLGIVKDSASVWLQEVPDVRCEHAGEKLVYSLRHELLGQGELRLEVHALGGNAAGFVAQATAIGVPPNVQLLWAYGGASGKVDSGLPALLPERCKDNVFSIEGSAFTLFFGENLSLKRMRGVAPAGSAMRVADARSMASPLGLLASSRKTDAPILVGTFALRSEPQYFAFFQRADYTHYMLPSLFSGSEYVSKMYTGRATAGLATQRVPPSLVYSVRDFGAKGDGKNIDSPAINAAIAAAASNGGGTVVLTAGRYLSYSIRLQSHITLRLEPNATIVAAYPTETEGYDAAEPNEHSKYQDFGHSHWKNSLLWGIGIEDVTIAGSGTIDGTGLTREGSRLPGSGNKAIALRDCRNVRLRDLQMLRCGHFALLATGVDNLLLSGLIVDTNRDGFDIDCCRNVRITDCTVNAPWDDAIVLKASYALGRFKDTENVTITGCYVSGFDHGSVLDGTYRHDEPQAPDHAYTTGRIKLGTESSGGFKNIAISSCVFERCRGLALETVDGGCLEDVVVSNITMRDIVNAPIFLRLGSRMRSPQGTPVGTLRRITISHVNVYNADSQYSSIISGIPGHPIEDVTLSHIRIHCKGGYARDSSNTVPPENENLYPEPTMFGTTPSSAFFVRHARNVKFYDVQMLYEQPDHRPAFVLLDTENVKLNEQLIINN